ncbi:MAG: ParB N-terminal domain-containing protein, partial [Gammaproteobacteria bacterium]
MRKPSNRQIQKCRRSIEAFGFVQPVLIRGLEIVDGNSRVEAARGRGLSKVPCISVDHLDER